MALTSGSQTVTGSGTSFTTALSVGQWLLFTSDPTETPYQIGAIASDTSLTLTVIYTGVTTASTMATLVDTTPASGFLAPASSSTSSFGLPSPLPQIAVYDGLGLQWNVLEDLLSSNGSQRVCVLRSRAQWMGGGEGRFHDPSREFLSRHPPDKDVDPGGNFGRKVELNREDAKEIRGEGHAVLAGDAEYGVDVCLVDRVDVAEEFGAVGSIRLHRQAGGRYRNARSMSSARRGCRYTPGARSASMT